ncbi:MAG: hypothetical protein Q4B43_04560 [Bacteroidota bacterium]|nr:hypothetical protein [Bacteroidota bacterium]
MNRDIMYSYTKKVLESVSFDPKLFSKELNKAVKSLLPYELEKLKKWLTFFIKQKPELQSYIKQVI